MFGYNPATIGLAEKRNAKKETMFDGIKKAVEQVTIDPIDERMAITLNANMRQSALAIVFQLAMLVSEGQGVDPEDELLPNELLDGLMTDAFDEDGDDEIDATVNAVMSAHISDAFSSLGVSDSTIADVFSDDLEVADTAIESACDTVLENLPEDGEPLDEFAKAFIFGDYTENDADIDDGGEGYDGAMFDANKKLYAGKSTIKKVNGHTVKYKAIRAMRHGKAVVVNKRVGGTIKLSSKQKAALRKARSKAHRGSAMMSRGRSILKGINSGKVYKHLNDKALSFLAGTAMGAKNKGTQKYLRGLRSNSTKVNNSLV